MNKMGVQGRMSLEKLANAFGYDNLDNFFITVGSGDITTRQIDMQLLAEEQQQIDADSVAEAAFSRARARSNVDQISSKGVQIMGVDQILTNLAKCCNPTPGDPIVGYITRGRGLTIHRHDCPNIASVEEANRLKSDVDWGSTSQQHTYQVPIEVVVNDRPGMVHDITGLIKDEKINLFDLYTQQLPGNLFVVAMTLEVSDTAQLSRTLDKISNLSDVIEAKRRNQKKPRAQ